MRFLLISACAFVWLLSSGAALGQIQPSGFHIAIVDGEGALNNVKGRLAREPIIQVEDENHKPVAGAYVVFDAPGSGPGAVFADGSTHLTTTTDAYGRAVAHGLRPNTVSGKFDIQVHVTYQGRPVGDVTVHQVNVSGQLAQLSKNLDNTATGAVIAAGVLGVVLGSEFLVNGNSIPGNANLTNGARIQTLGTTAKLYLRDQCEVLVAPHSAVTVQPGQIDLQTGILRAQHFGSCKVSYLGLQVVGAQGTADALVAVAGDGLQVASINGAVRVLAANGSLLEIVDQPGILFTYGTVSGASSGASAGTQVAHRKRVPFYYLALGTSLAGLGVAVETISQAPPTPTSP